ncbi:hypothetical protein HZB03_03455 [Candidatus Woesearchaeota archaeon]|nr:hypothetical protein [Candidatus Woesearchaeota archaeon]
MATFLEVGLLQHFSVIFPVLLVFVTVFALLQQSKMFGENKGIHSLIAISIALLMLFSPGVVQVIGIMAPWFVLIFIFILLILLGFKFLGVSDKSIAETMSSWGTIHWFLLVIGIIIFIGAISSVYGASLLPFSGAATTTIATAGGNTTTSTGDFNANVGRTIFHPKVIGTVFILVVGSFTIKLLCGSSK